VRAKKNSDSRVQRGGGYYHGDVAGRLRVTFRCWIWPDCQAVYYGFRLVIRRQS